MLYYNAPKGGSPRLKLHIADEQPRQLHLPGDDELFNKTFDVASGVETASLWVTPNRFMMFDYASTRPDAKGLLAYFACCWIGRAADLHRCNGVAVRQHQDGRIEIRLRFDSPWYWNKVVHERTAGEPALTAVHDLVNHRAVDSA